MCPTVMSSSPGLSGPHTEASSGLGTGTISGRFRSGIGGAAGGGLGTSPVTVTVSVSCASPSCRSRMKTSPALSTTVGFVRVSNPDISNDTA